MAVAVDDHHWVCILDLETSQFIQKKEIFERFRTEDGGADQYSVDTLALSLSGHRLYLSGFETGDLYVYNTNTMEQETVYPGRHDVHCVFLFMNRRETLFVKGTDEARTNNIIHILNLPNQVSCT